MSGIDNWGVIVVIIGLLIEALWWNSDFPNMVFGPDEGSGDYSDSKPSNSKTIYDKDGKITGYMEKD
jgi:hypothetical protein